MQLSSKIAAIVTGGASGIGLSCVTIMARLGAKVAEDTDVESGSVL